MMTRSLSVLLLVSLFACEKRKLNEVDLKAYIVNDEHGLHKQVEKNGVIIEVFYKPAQFVWQRDIADEHDKKKREAMIQTCDTLTYFSLHFSRNGKEIENAYVSDPAFFDRVINYLSFDISNDLYLLTDTDTIHAIDAVYSRTFGAGTSTIVTGVFDTNIEEQARAGNVKLVFDDKMFETGLNEFTFQATDIKNRPTLTFN
jgi:hypothetical protein